MNVFSEESKLTVDSGQLKLVYKDDVELSFRGETLTWDMRPFEKAKSSSTFYNKYDVFEQINGYWATLSEEHQAKLFAIYKEMRDVFSSTWEMPALTKGLQPLVRELYELHDLDHLKHWVDYRANVVIPSTIHATYEEGQNNINTRVKTYVREDYQWLLVLTIAIRALFPILSEFIQRTRSETKTVFKEYRAVELLKYTKLAHSIPMEKLRAYVTHAIPADKSKSSAILEGISSEDFPDWMLSLVLVRRLTIGDVRGTDPTSMLIPYIFNYVDYKVRNNENSFSSGRINDKNFDSSGQDTETNLSILENYKMREDLSSGEVMVVEYGIRDSYALAKKLAPDIDPQLVKQSLASVRTRLNHRIYDPQVILAQNVLANEIPPRGLLHLNKIAVLEGIAVAQAVLWHCGYRELAALISAIEIPNNETNLLNYSTSRQRIPKEMVERLHELYPFSRRTAARPKATRAPSSAAVQVDVISDAFVEHDWRLTIPSPWIAKLNGNPKQIAYSAPSDLRIILASLFIAIAESPMPFHSPRKV